MTAIKVTPIGEALQLGEGPHWDAQRQQLLYVDLAGARVYKYKPDTKKITSTKIDSKTVGFVLPVAGSANRFIIGKHRVLSEIEWDGVSEKPSKICEIYDVDGANKADRLNDAKCDPKGRLFCGTMGREHGEDNFDKDAGALYRVDARGSAPKVLRENIGISNGLAWADEKFYYIDSLAYQVDSYDYDVNTGHISNKKVILDFKKTGLDGLPDGMCVDHDGKLWIACFGAGQVIRVDPKTGTCIQTIPIPARQTTSVCFGGKNLDVLYVTSAAVHSQAGKPLAGHLFEVTGLGVTGPAGVDCQI